MAYSVWLDPGLSSEVAKYALQAFDGWVQAAPGLSITTSVGACQAGRYVICLTQDLSVQPPTADLTAIRYDPDLAAISYDRATGSSVITLHPSAWTDGGMPFAVVQHEVGHALGLGHGPAGSQMWPEFYGSDHFLAPPDMAQFWTDRGLQIPGVTAPAAASSDAGAAIVVDAGSDDASPDVAVWPAPPVAVDAGHTIPAIIQCAWPYYTGKPQPFFTLVTSEDGTQEACHNANTGQSGNCAAGPTVDGVTFDLPSLTATINGSVGQCYASGAIVTY